MVYFRLTSVRSLARFICKYEHLQRICGLKDTTPCYRTLSRRFKKLDDPIIKLSQQLIKKLVCKKVLKLAILTVDGSLLQAKGKPQPKKRPDIKPTDKEAKWGYSKTCGWVWGYKLHLLATVEPCIAPLNWLVTTANLQECPKFLGLLESLLGLLRSMSKRIKTILGDSGYEAMYIYNRCKTYMINFICPIKDGKKNHPRSEERIKRLRLFKTNRIKQLFKRRADVERLYSQLKDLFTIDPLPVVGKQKVTTYLNLVSLAYLAALYYNNSNGRKLRNIKSIVA
jgi:hypothetical protein